MFGIDAVFERQLTHQHLEKLIQDAQQEQFAREVEAAQKPDKAISPLRVILVAILHMIWR